MAYFSETFKFIRRSVDDGLVEVNQGEEEVC
jgi:hypothetical protein